MSFAETFKALSDPVRRDILTMLKKGRLSAGEIEGRFDISFPAVSRHLSVLKDADLVRDERDGKNVYYSLNTSVLEEILAWLEALKGDGND